MAYYRPCQYCGCNLDPGERCDCQDKKKEVAPLTRERPQALIATNSLSMQFKNVKAEGSVRYG